MGAITLSTARLRSTGWALVRAPVYLGTLTNRPVHGLGRPRCPKNGTQNLFSIGPLAQAARAVSLQGQGGPCGKREAFSMRGNLARSSGSQESWLT